MLEKRLNDEHLQHISLKRCPSILHATRHMTTALPRETIIDLKSTMSLAQIRTAERSTTKCLTIIPVHKTHSTLLIPKKILTGRTTSQGTNIPRGLAHNITQILPILQPSVLLPTFIRPPSVYPVCPLDPQLHHIPQLSRLGKRRIGT